MKKVIPILLAGMLTLSSCGDWLSATSSTTLPAEEMFSTPDGFYNALTGVYLTMTNSSLYGQNMTFLYADVCSVPYVSSNTTAIVQMQTHNYTGIYAKNIFLSSWKKGYEAISNVNMILKQIEENGDVLRSESELNLIKGELLALRAFLHFDKLRYWGIGSWSGDNASKLTIPYVTVYSKNATPQKTYAETADLLEKDILGALECLKKDPATGWSDDEFESVSNAEGYWDHRARHLNYYAVELLAARFYMWKGDNDKAQSYAQDIIDNAFDKGLVQWADAEAMLLPKSNATEIDWTLSTEHLFSLDDQDLYSYSSPLYTEMSLSGLFIQPELVKDVLYPATDSETGSVSGAEDIRGTALMLKYSGNGYSNYKLYTTSTNTQTFANLMPLMRVAEAYYIVAECALNAGDNAKALDMLNTVRKHRGISEDLPSTCSISKEIEKEYYREFINEGQILPFLKRTGKTTSLYPDFKFTQDDLLWRYPQDEINYGRVQEK